MIYKFDNLKSLFEEIDKKLKTKTSIYIIGGAALLHYGVGKGYTKDIDIVFNNKTQFESYRDALHELDFMTAYKPKNFEKLEIFEMLEKGEFRFDLFVNTVVNYFCLSDNMINRSIEVLNLNFLKVNICSKEDIVLFKSLSPDRENDIEDSIDLIKRGINWKIIYNELKNQYKICNNSKKSRDMVWYFIERIHDLEKRKITVSIKKEVNNFYDSINK